jgi:hypothetical protein
VFYLNIAYVCNGFQAFLGIFASVLEAFLSVSSVFFCMLQVLHLDISKVDRRVQRISIWSVWIRFSLVFLASMVINGDRQPLQQ